MINCQGCRDHGKAHKRTFRCFRHGASLPNTTVGCNPEAIPPGRTLVSIALANEGRLPEGVLFSQRPAKAYQGRKRTRPEGKGLLRARWGPRRW